MWVAREIEWIIGGIASSYAGRCPGSEGRKKVSFAGTIEIAGEILTNGDDDCGDAVGYAKIRRK